MIPQNDTAHRYRYRNMALNNASGTVTHSLDEISQYTC